MDNTLQHYASKYYDPVKAHEYYEAHKKLKGRTSTAGLNEEGRKVASYVKSTITQEKKNRLESNAENRRSQIEYRRQAKDKEIETYRAEMNQRIDSLKATLKNMTKEQRAQNRERISGIIDELRQENRSKRESLTSQFKSDAAGINIEAKGNAENIRTDADNKYASELAKIKSEEKYQAKKKGKIGSKVSKEQLDKFVKSNLAALKQK